MVIVLQFQCDDSKPPNYSDADTTQQKWKIRKKKIHNK